MLFVFQLDTCRMMCFEMDVAISTVSTLKSKIEKIYGIPIDKQVLIVTGGGILEPSSQICDGLSGVCDSNPIFLCNKLNIEPTSAQQAEDSTADDYSYGGGSIQLSDRETIATQIESMNSLPPTYLTVATRAQMAKHMHEMGAEIIRRCEVLIHHQHLQHQGWLAVVANLDDIVNVFSLKFKGFLTAHETFCKKYPPERIDTFIHSLDTTLRVLDSLKIPDYCEDASLSPSESCQKSIVSWLSDYYSSARSMGESNPLYAHLKTVSTNTRNTYDTLTLNNYLSSMKQEVELVMGKAQDQSIKEVAGLDGRLSRLDELLKEAKKVATRQNEFYLAFKQNVSRANALNDPSIFPDLCVSHQEQLMFMYKNHCHLEDILRKFSAAKDELTHNINQRLWWVACMQKNLSEIGINIGVSHESLKRLRVNVNVLQQVHESEHVFGKYVQEARARGRVTRKLAELASKIAEWGRICSTENARRAKFIEEHGNHFLSQAFSRLIQDRAVQGIVVPNLVEYVYEKGDDDEDDDTFQCDAEKTELKGRIKELEGVVATLTASKSSAEAQLGERNIMLDVERERVRNLSSEIESARNDAAESKAKVDKLTGQVDDLKRLIDEFRIKEDEAIRVREMEVAENNKKMQNLQDSCNERVVELTRMLQFENEQKIKQIEESHKMEINAMIKRFKHVSECSQKMRVSESGGVPLSPGAGVRGRITSESDANARTGFSEDEESDIVARNRTDSIRIEEDDGEERGSSLERAQDAMLLHDETCNASSSNCSSEVGVTDRVVGIATRLHKLGRISVSSCRVGDVCNLLYWNERFNAFTVYLSNKNVHFLHTTGNEEEFKDLSNKNVYLASITDKEFCVARRPKNRYNVPQGFHFYRVKCKLVEVIEEL